jgi:hypothetical protein
MKARTIDREILAHQKPLMENSISKKPPSRTPLISVSVAFCQFLPPSTQVHNKAKRKEKSSRDMVNLFPTLHNLQHLHEILLHLASLTAKTGGNAGDATKFKPTTSCCEIQGDPEIPI